MENIKRFFALVLFFSISLNSFAVEKEIEPEELDQILDTLTSNYRHCWIENGRVSTDHISYRKLTGETKQTLEKIKYLDQKFISSVEIVEYEKDIDDAIDKTTSPIDVEGNRKRIFGWDGNKYTMYFVSGHHAIVTEDTADIPINVGGALRAGFVSWGNGAFSRKSLAKSTVKAYEKYTRNNKKLIEMSILTPAKYMLSFTLDPAKSYAPLEYTIVDQETKTGKIITRYDEYKLFKGNWVPKAISKEVYKNTESFPILYSYDYWDINYSGINKKESFEIEFNDGDHIEYKTAGLAKKFLFEYLCKIDPEDLLMRRIGLLIDNPKISGNCAAVSTNYVMSKLDKKLSDSDLIGPIFGEEMTSMDKMMELAAKYKINTAAIKTDLKTLKAIKNTQTILYMPGQSHYVVLGHIDDENVWIIDLSSDKFIKKYNINTFSSIWKDGIALVFSDKRLRLKKDITELSLEEAGNIRGGSNNCYACTRIIQYYTVEFCSEPMGLFCGGQYRMWYLRYGCEENTSGSGECNCVGSKMPGNTYASCILDVDNPGACTTANNWTTEYMRACD